eukprot:gene9902-10915_t
MAVVGHLFLKCAATIVLFGITVLCGLLPMKFIKKHGQSQRQKTFVGLCNCFAGGVFFSTCLLDLLPLVRDKMNSALLEVNTSTHFPLGEFIAAFGFILMLATELVVHSLGKDDWLGDHAHVGRDMEDFEHEPLLRNRRDIKYGAQDDESQISSGKQVQQENGGPSPPLDAGDITPINDDVFKAQSSRPTTPSEFGDEITCIQSRPKSKLKRTKSISSVNVVVHSSFRIYILIIALSLHSLFEGLSVGLFTEVDTLIQILIALLIHKSILAFALGVKLIDGGLPGKKIVKGIILFAAMAPIGVGLGLAVLSSVSHVANFFCSGILQGLATGSFLYVTFFEILPEEFSLTNTNKGQKVLTLMFGFFLIAGMCYYENQFHHMKKILPNSGGKKP